MNFKTNKRKFVAKILLLVLLATSALTLTACPGGKGHHMRLFNSHDELLKFVEKYNSKNDGFVYTFVSFDFENNKAITPYRYGLTTIWTLRHSLITDEMKYINIYDKDHSIGNYFNGEIIFYIDELSVQVRCNYNTRKDYNFYQNDEMTVEDFEDYSFIELDSDSAKMLEIYSNHDEFLKAFADVRTRSQETWEYEKYYSYMVKCYIKINSKYEVSVYILSDDKLTQEHLNYIKQLLLDNIVIINTEG